MRWSDLALDIILSLTSNPPSTQISQRGIVLEETRTVPAYRPGFGNHENPAPKKEKNRRSLPVRKRMFGFWWEMRWIPRWNSRLHMLWEINWIIQSLSVLVSPNAVVEERFELPYYPWDQSVRSIPNYNSQYSSWNLRKDKSWKRIRFSRYTPGKTFFGKKKCMLTWDFQDLILHFELWIWYASEKNLHMVKIFDLKNK